MADVAPETIRRCHANSVECYRAFARAITGARIRESDDLFLSDSGDTNPLGNVAWVLRPPADAGRAMAKVRDFFAVTGVPWIVLAVPESARSVNECAPLAGLRYEGLYPGMLLDPLLPLPAGDSGKFNVRPVRSEEELHSFDSVEARAYGVALIAPEPRLLGVTNLTMFVGYLDGVPQAVAGLVVSDRIAGIVAVGTVPEARGRGFAQKVVQEAVEVGRQRGCTQSFLWATERGRHVYGKMGFRKILDYPVWTPTDRPLPLDTLPVRDPAQLPPT